MPRKDETPQVALTMSPDEFAELRAAAAAVGQQDVQLGRVLDLLVLHLGHAHDLDPTVEDAKAQAAAEEAAKAAEEAAAAATPVEPAAEGEANAS